jgi:hypothetical protein
MPLDLVRRFIRREPEEYRLLLHGKVIRQPNPLPKLCRRLYKERPKDRFAGLEALEEDLRESVADTVHLMRIPNEEFRRVVVYNCLNILRIPPIYTLMRVLRRRGMERFVHNAHRVASALHACASYGTSDLVNQIHSQLMPMLLGIYARHFGVPFLKEDELTSMLQRRKFDVSDPKERELRDEFLKRYAQAAERLAQVSVDRFNQHLGTVDYGNRSIQIIEDIILYSTRLMGRTAVSLSRSQEQDIHQLAAYTGVLYSVCSAQYATGKRLCLLLAEEYGRSRIHRRHEGVDKTARYNVFALQDFMAACRCHVLDFFQGKDETALYSEPERLYMREVTVDGRSQWCCYRNRKDSAPLVERGKRGRNIAHNARYDPADEDLVEVECLLSG